MSAESDGVEAREFSDFVQRKAIAMTSGPAIAVVALAESLVYISIVASKMKSEPREAVRAGLLELVGYFFDKMYRTQ